MTNSYAFCRRRSVIYLFFLSIFGCAGYTMIDEDEQELSSQENTLTVAELSNFVFDQCKSRPFYSERESDCDTKEMGLRCKAMCLSLIPSMGALVPGIIYCAKFCQSVREKCLKDCPASHKNSTCFNICPMDRSWVDPPNCALGIGIMFIPPVLTFLSGYFGPKLVRKYTTWIKKNNDLLRVNIHENFNFRDGQDKVTDEELRYYARMLMHAKSYLIKKLTFHQTLILAQVDLLLFHEMVTLNFSHDYRLSVLSEQLAMFSRMDVEALEKNLENESILDIFNADKRVWETLVRILSEEVLTTSVQRKLVDILIKMTKESDHHPKLLANDFIHQIRKNKNIEHIIAPSIETGENLDGPVISLSRKNGLTLNIPLNKLIEISGFFANTFVDCSQIAQAKDQHEHTRLLDDNDKPLFNLDIEDGWLDVLEDVYLQNKLNFSEKNLKNIFDAAVYFQIHSLLAQCDKYLVDSENLQDQFLLTIMKKNKPSFKDKWTFCDGNNLTLNKRKLAQDFLRNFADTLDKDISLVRDYLDEFQSDIDKDIFKNKLNDQDTLRMAWENFHDYPVLKKIMVEFCAANCQLYAATWLFPDVELKTAVKAIKTNK